MPALPHTVDRGSCERRRVPDWAEWSSSAPYSVGIEEEVMLLDPMDWAPAHESAAVLERRRLGRPGTMSAETHACAVELATEPQATAAGAARQLHELRAELVEMLRPLGLRAASAGTHPTVRFDEIEVSEGARYQSLLSSLRELARREPTFALHIHVGVEHPERALELLNAMRGHLPLLLALSANSPFWAGRDARLASARIPIFDGFPRVGPPREFPSYHEYVTAVDALLEVDAIPEPTFLWWDARLQPRFGTVEVRIMDAQSKSARAGALAALVQVIAHFELEGAGRRPGPELSPEMLAENRFLACRDGMAAQLIDPVLGRRSPARDQLRALLTWLTDHASELGAADAMAEVAEIALDPGAERQRRVAADSGLHGLLRWLADEFGSR